MQIKGIQDGLLVTLEEGVWEDLQAALLQHIAERAAFFKGAKMAVDTGNHILRSAELSDLRTQLGEHSVNLWAVLSTSLVTEQSAQGLGMATRIGSPRGEAHVEKRGLKSIENQVQGEGAVFVQRTLRSGLKVSNKGHVIVIGDVNPGAEIIATGNVVIWGRLRGVVHAGAEGDESAIVCALDLDPMQLRIAGLVAIPPKKRSKVEPEMAQIVDGQVVATAWKTGKR